MLDIDLNMSYILCFFCFVFFFRFFLTEHVRYSSQDFRNCQQAVLGSVPLTITKHTKKLKDREDEIFQLWCWLFNTTGWLVWRVYSGENEMQRLCGLGTDFTERRTDLFRLQGSLITWWTMCCGIDVHCHLDVLIWPWGMGHVGILA